MVRVTKRSKDTDSESESTDVEATPKAKRSGGGAAGARLKRRVSQYQPNDDDDDQSIPIKHVNDEIAEKRSLKRRKSQRMTMAFDSVDASADSPSAEQDASAGTEGPKTPKKTALARANQIRSVAVPAPMVPVPLEIMTSNFEEWMKMATDNKINATNSWSFALIDYFHDMSLLRNDSDNSINFQKASRTLDGCVKIWTSRVDSVGTDTGKLLSNLVDEGRVAETGEDGEEGGEGGEAKKRKAHRQEATLAKNAAQLQTKKLDLEFAVDPLFKKTSGDFDEGGAQGLLMNHLGVDSGLRVIFDAMDTPGGAEEVEDEEVVTLQVSLADLRAKLDYPTLSDRMLQSERLADFKFSANVTDQPSQASKSFYGGGEDELDSEDEAAFQNPPVAGDAMDIVEDTGAENGVAPQEPQDFFAGDDAANDYGGFGGDQDYGDAEGDHSGEMDADEEGRETGDGPSRAAPFDPRRVPDQRELVMAMTEDGGVSMMDYFDSSVIKNWAGPEHWKLRKVIRKPERAEQSAAPKPRKEKEVFSIDFSKRNTEEYEKKLFEPPAKGTLTLPAKQCAYIGGKRKRNPNEKREEKLLPDDMHFSSKQLLSLFLKPKFQVSFRGHRGWLRPEHSDEIDEHFWAKAAAEASMPPEEVDQTQDGGALPFATQFFQDDDDYGGDGFGDAYDGAGDDGGPGVDEDAELLAATQGQVRRVRPAFVNYAKKVKRVDVRKLKENIWKGLDIVVPKQEEEEIDPKDTRPPTDPEEAKQFTSVISGLRRSYPKEKMEEISTSFCFICLLHLANERGLKIEPEDDGGLGSKMSGLSLYGNRASRQMIDEDDPNLDLPEMPEEKEKVGDIWGLRIYRDPDAIPSA